MHTLEKVGYILVGVGIGGLIATVLYERELNKPVGEVEEYIPKGAEEDDKKANSEKDGDPISAMRDLYSSSSSSEFDPKSSIDIGALDRKHVGKKRTLYSKMYKVNVDDQDEIEYEEQDYDEESDSPSDDEVYEEDVVGLDNELVRERVENDFEIYLGDNPQDFVTLIFYQGDSTMTDDQEQLVPNPEDVVGHVAISRLIEGGPGAEEGVIYVRNLKTMINYEIVLDAGSYRDTVLGIFNSRSNNGADRRGDTR